VIREREPMPVDHRVAAQEQADRFDVGERQLVGRGRT
jgi:hypothetical protein